MKRKDKKTTWNLLLYLVLYIAKPLNCYRNRGMHEVNKQKKNGELATEKSTQTHRKKNWRRIYFAILENLLRIILEKILFF